MSKRKLLLADDSPTIQKVVNLTFGDEGIEVIAFGDGDSALAAVESERPDIILADVNMPGANGYQLCAAVKQKAETAHIPVILLVGSFEPFDEEKALSVGANAYLTKPFQSIRQLVARVRELISRTADEVIKQHLPEHHQVETNSGSIETETPSSLEAYDNTRESVSHESTIEPENIESETSALDKSSSPGTEADDIERLYLQSLASGEKETLGEIGIDDEIIEESYSAPETAPVDFELPVIEDDDEKVLDGPYRFGESDYKDQEVSTEHTFEDRQSPNESLNHEKTRLSEPNLDLAEYEASLAENTTLNQDVSDLGKGYSENLVSYSESISEAETEPLDQNLITEAGKNTLAQTDTKEYFIESQKDTAELGASFDKGGALSEGLHTSPEILFRQEKSASDIESETAAGFSRNNFEAQDNALGQASSDTDNPVSQEVSTSKNEISAGDASHATGQAATGTDFYQTNPALDDPLGILTPVATRLRLVAEKEAKAEAQKVISISDELIELIADRVAEKLRGKI
ncbi:MAG TPA: response regulator [Pyrinomonadaceae bacterium]|nr:response regulator [Pyrinomonadaceae bacterium]